MGYTSLAAGPRGMGRVGIAPVVVGAGISVGEKLLNPHPDDPARLQQNADHYRMALTGDATAFQWLGIVGGLLPPIPGRGIGATDTQKNDAAQKYQSLAPHFQGSPGAVPGNAFGDAGVPAKTPAGAPTMLGLGSANLPLLLAIGVGAFVLSKTVGSGRRGRR